VPVSGVRQLPGFGFAFCFWESGLHAALRAESGIARYSGAAVEAAVQGLAAVFAELGDGGDAAAFGTGDSICHLGTQDTIKGVGCQYQPLKMEIPNSKSQISN
jgi:hypothetical protein